MPNDRHRYQRLAFGTALTGDMFQRKIDRSFEEVHYGIADDILVVGYYRGSTDHDVTLQRILKTRKN